MALRAERRYRSAVLEEIGRRLGLTRERVRQIEAAALRRLALNREINSTVADAQARMQELAGRYKDGQITHLDGLSVSYPTWHFNVRGSNTEPLLRLNLESIASRAEMEQRRDEVLAIIRG